MGDYKCPKAHKEEDSKNTEGFCKTQDDDNVFSRPVTNLIWNLFQKSSIF